MKAAARCPLTATEQISIMFTLSIIFTPPLIYSRCPSHQFSDYLRLMLIFPSWVDPQKVSRVGYLAPPPMFVQINGPLLQNTDAKTTDDEAERT